MSLDSVRDKIKETNIKRYGVEWSAQNKEINQKTINTQIKKYGGVFNPEKVKKTNIEKYGVEKPFMSSDIQNKIRDKKDIILKKVNNTKRINGTFNSSNTEKVSKTLLIEKFGIDNVIEQYKSDLYPFYCDFYIKNLDLYIECNYHWTHGGHIFNKDNIDDWLTEIQVPVKQSGQNLEMDRMYGIGENYLDIDGGIGEIKISFDE